MTKPEKKLQDKAIDYLEANKIYHINKYGDGRTAIGAPDLYVCINGRFVCFELKVGSNNMSDAQQLHKIWIERSGGLHYSPYTLEEFINIVEELKNGKED